MNIPPAKSRRRSLAQLSSPPVILPDELVCEVLSFLTVKLLMRFRCVCKSWNALIDSPNFIKIHQKKSERNKQIIQIERDYSIESKYLIVNSCPIRGLMENPLITHADKHYCRLTEDRLYVVGSCNGLVCLLGFNQLENWFYFYNPATRKVSEKLGSFTRTNRSNIAFGFDNSTDTYKVVEFCQMSRDVRVFSLGDNIWRNIQSFPNVFIPFKVGYNSCRGGVYLNGTLNWLVFRNDIIYDDSKNRMFEHYAIISLDLGIETYTQLLPPRDSREVLLNESTICVLMDCLCFCHLNFDMGTTNFVLWKMKNFGVEKCWSQFLNISNDNLQIRCSQFRKFSEFCSESCRWVFPLCHSENGDTLMLANCRAGQLILYNWRTNKVERIMTTTKRKRWVFRNNYVESLVSTNGKILWDSERDDGPFSFPYIFVISMVSFDRNRWPFTLPGLEGLRALLMKTLLVGPTILY
ncbi:putative F-box domain, galactose oxidase, beta-propeller, F-box associated interaction [Medicago truncatula]|uniref:F-box protein interaction domain protein n=1 Tax=Medicago truncatula TaxID=3880 RepID=A0A072U018_MEDTR|nr:F-box protein interaction domain protein [Medicago truncatula]RHN46384.1 putative F-box domain, galactose oxidase, beta-propeller, F-box associated interaction [Medicago truncatula]